MPFGKEVIAPLYCVSQRLLARRQVASTSGEELQPLGQPRGRLGKICRFRSAGRGERALGKLPPGAVGEHAGVVVRVAQEAGERGARRPERPLPAGPVRCYPHGVSRELLERTVRDLGVDLRLVARPEAADLIIALRTRAEDLGLKRILRQTDTPLHYIKRNTSAELRRLLQKVFNIVQGVDEEEIQETVRETEEAMRRVTAQGGAVALTPRQPALRKMQHRMIAGHGLVAESVGREPGRHLVVRSPEGEG